MFLVILLCVSHKTLLVHHLEDTYTFPCKCDAMGSPGAEPRQQPSHRAMLYCEKNEYCHPFPVSVHSNTVAYRLKSHNYNSAICVAGAAVHKSALTVRPRDSAMHRL